MTIKNYPPRALDEAPLTPTGAIWPAMTGKHSFTPTSEPVISVITPVKRGGGGWLKECWQSLLQQDEVRWEWLVELDGSGDVEPEITELLEQADSRLKVASCGIRMYAAACRNMALSRAQGEWVFPLDADDLVPKNSFSTLLGGVKAANAKACVGTIEIIQTDGTRTYEHHKFVHGIRLQGESNKIALELQQLPHLSVGTLMETRLLTMLGGYPAAPYAQDLLVQYLVAAFGDIVAVPETTYTHRRHDHQMTAETDDLPWRLAQWRSRVMLSRMVVAQDKDAQLPNYPVF